MRKYNDRRKVNEFLLALEKFVSENRQIPGLEQLFVAPILFDSTGRVPAGRYWTSLVPLPTLAKACNPLSQSPSVINAKRKHVRGLLVPIPDEERRTRFRSSAFVYETAYGLEYESVPDLSYEHLFVKYAVLNGINMPIMAEYEGFLDRFSGSLSRFHIPKQFVTDGSLVIYQ